MQLASRSPVQRSDFPLSDDQIHRVARPSLRKRPTKAVRLKMARILRPCRTE